MLRRQDSHFWGRYVLALCHLSSRYWVGAKVELTVCLKLRPTFALPLLLRGWASTELGLGYGQQAEAGKGELARGHLRAMEAGFASAQPISSPP